MPRSSRHRSHRGHRHDRDRSGSASSEEEVVVVERSGISRRRRDGSPPMEESESKKRKTSPLTRVPVESANAAADPPTDQGGRKRKERDSKPAGDGDAVAAATSAGGGTDRWNGDAGVVGPAEDKRMKVDGPASPDVEKAAKGKLSASDLKTRAATSGRRHSGADGVGKDEISTAPKDESARRRSEKESTRKDTTTDRDKERVPDKDHGHGPSRNGERSSEKDNRGHHHAQRKEVKEVEPELSKDDKSKRSKERPPNADVDVPHNPDRDAGRKMQDDLFSSDTDRKPKKQIPREASNDKGKSKGDGRDNEDKPNDLDRNGDSRDPEKHRRYRDRSREDIERDRRPRDDRHRIGADRPSRDHSNDRSESRYQKDMSKRIENHRRQDKERESPPPTRDHAKYMDSRVRKRTVTEKEESICTKSRGEVEFQVVVERNRLDSDYNNDDRSRPESVHSNKVHSNSRHKQPRSSPSSAIHILQDEYRRSTREEPSFHSALSKDKNHTSSASSGDRASISGAAEKALDSFSVESNAKVKETPRSAECMLEDGRPPRSDSHLSGIQLPERSPGSDRCNTDRKGNISSGSPSKVPPPPVRHGSGSPSVQGSVEYDGKTQSADHRSFSRYKRNGDSKMGRSHGSSWNGVPNWPRPGLNGYMPFPHGPPGPFHQVGQQYPGPSLFGVRPLMDFNHAGVPFHMHEAPDRFTGRQFGWHNPPGDSGPQFPGWDGNGGMFGNDSRVFGREWEHGRHSINQGWETSGVMKGQDEKSPMELESDKQPDLLAQVRTNENTSEEFENQSKRNLIEHDNMRQKVTTPLVQRETKLKADPALKSSNNDNSPSFLGLVLSKLDISLNLTCPELYRRINSNQDGGDTSSNSSVLKQMNGQASVERPNSGATRIFINGTRPSLPNITEDIFKKAVSLYQINGESGNGIKVSKDIPAEENIRRNTFSGENKTSLDVPSVDKDNNRTANRLPENALEPMDVGDTDVEKQEPATTAKFVGDYNNDLNNVSGSSIQLCKNQVGSDLVESCSKECVGLIPEYVSRIHSPGSSH